MELLEGAFTFPEEDFFLEALLTEDEKIEMKVKTFPKNSLDLALKITPQTCKFKCPLCKKSVQSRILSPFLNLTLKFFPKLAPSS